MAATDRQEEPFIANGLKERLGMRMERREEEKRERMGLGGDNSAFVKLVFQKFHSPFKFRRKGGRQFEKDSGNALETLLSWFIDGSQRVMVRSPEHSDISHTIKAKR